MKRIGYLLILCSLFFVMSGCEKDTEPVNFAPKLTTGKVDGIFRTGATLFGEMVKPEGGSCERIRYSLFHSSEYGGI